jgi:hypothetical protein
MNKDSQEYQRVKLEVAKELALNQGWLWDRAILFPHIYKHYMEQATQFLCIEGLAILADNQTIDALPIELDEPFQFLRNNRPEEFGAGASAMRGAMLTAGFKKIA